MLIGNKIKRLRTDNGWSQTDLGNKIGRPQNSISQMEHGIMPIDSETIQKLSEVFNISASYFVENEKDYLQITAESEKTLDATNILVVPSADTETLQSFAIKLIQTLLQENIIKDPNKIPKETESLILAALKEDILRINANKNK